ncbi:acyl-CoA transferase [Paenirhodobacter sp. CAU 1674]|uniref:acyl-CoA transferase n=1 Tax=Paenirhodobacter sp. CAU 1674 TaxID=3032596 RepID=UPI0023DA48E2|nr:acyl-CoA transferase [Paenirhodobacter sp. CAU 1674]MDF2140856.1 acyl-CoA transferase [Paenirhodobacter sp. CAU 1674]
MPDSKSEEVIKALLSVIEDGAPVGASVVRNATLPTRIPDGGWICLRDGDPGQPEVLLSPPLYIYEHRAEVDVVVEMGSALENFGTDVREARFDEIKRAIGTAIAADRTLGGLCDYVIGEAPTPVEIPVDGAEYLKAATIGIVLTYGSSDPLA